MTYLLRKIMVITALVITTTGFAQESCQTVCASEPCCPESCGHFFGSAEWLYLRAFEGGLSSACSSTETVDATVDGVLTSTLTGKGHDPDFDWNSGFRLGAGYQFADSKSDLVVYWTNFYSSTSGDNNWKINFNVVDVLYCYECDWSNCVVLTPFAGLRYADIDQKLNSLFVSFDDGIASTSTTHSKEDFYGFGPLFGVEGDWGIGCGFSLYGNVSAAILYGRFHTRSHQTDVFDTGTNINYLRENIEACQPVLDFGFGVRWKTCLCDDQLLVLQLGFEEHRYFNHNQLCDYGDLSLDGISLGLGIEY